MSFERFDVAVQLGTSWLPTDISHADHKYLKGPHVLQVISAVDACVPSKGGVGSGKKRWHPRSFYPVIAVTAILWQTVHPPSCLSASWIVSEWLVSCCTLMHKKESSFVQQLSQLCCRPLLASIPKSVHSEFIVQSDPCHPSSSA